MDGAKLRETRLAAGLSAREVAEVAGVTARSIERAESRVVRPTTAARHVAAIRGVLIQRLADVDALLAASV